MLFRRVPMLVVNMICRIVIPASFCILWDILWGYLMGHIIATSCGYHAVLAMHYFIISGSLHWCHAGSYYVY